LPAPRQPNTSAKERDMITNEHGFDGQNLYDDVLPGETDNGSEHNEFNLVSEFEDEVLDFIQNNDVSVTQPMRDDVHVFPKPKHKNFNFMSEYSSWSPKSSSLLTKISSPSNAILDELLEIVGIEGPILSSYLARKHYKATGGSSLSAASEYQYELQIKRLLDRQYLVSEMHNISDNVMYRSLRTPEQPQVKIRVRGPRDLYEMPPLEIAMIMKNTLQSNSNLINGSDREMFFRQVLLLLDFTKLTSKADEHLNRIYTTYNHLIKGDH
jgi:hypothetical protein